jgi:hypothetical protein
MEIMDSVSALIIEFLSSFSQFSAQSSVPPATPPPSISFPATKHILPIVPMPATKKSDEYSCRDYGKPDAFGNLDYCLKK